MIAHPLFAYGTLQDSDILAAVLGRRVDQASLVVAHLTGFAAVLYPGRAYPALIPRPGAETAGCLVLGLGDADRAALDAFEGGEYRRDVCLVETASGPHAAHVYLPTQTIAEDAPLWTLEHWRERHRPGVIAAETALARAARQGIAIRKPGA